MSQPFGVFVPPAHDPNLARTAINVLISLEFTLQMDDDYDCLHPDDVRAGLVDPVLEVAMWPGAARMLERFAASPRLQAWITTPKFGRYGEDYVPAIKHWLTSNQLSERVVERLGYTNLILDEALHYTPRAIHKHPQNIAESDLIDVLSLIQVSRYHGGRQATG